MPEIARFFGLIIRMFAEPGVPHNLPHFHVYYQNHAEVNNIDPIELLSGDLPLRQKRFLEAWVEMHQGELADNWERLQLGQLPYKIAPLQ
ncbi:hypothetical protein BMS3Bbin03_00682 [bacterium BMS3Bbin03]|nr:hypothetical protein BMS3Bbin03_00682 [bacterium BMS3Bbin03]